jgi:hypothetical protein
VVEETAVMSDYERHFFLRRCTTNLR